MKTKNLNLKPEVNALDHTALLLHEQLALKRLKELSLEVKPGSTRRPTEKKLSEVIFQIAGRVGALTWAALFKQPPVSRQVTPDQPPVEWHGLERARQMRAMRIL